MSLLVCTSKEVRLWESCASLGERIPIPESSSTCCCILTASSASEKPSVASPLAPPTMRERRSSMRVKSELGTEKVVDEEDCGDREFSFACREEPMDASANRSFNVIKHVCWIEVMVGKNSWLP